jgi:outer membrane protein assembly factor BamB
VWRTEFDYAGSIALAGDIILVGGHHSTGDNEKGQGRMFGLSKQTGKIVWSVTHDAIPQRIHDMVANIASTPFVDGDRAYYISNRGELCCVRPADGHVNWMLDMPQAPGVFKRLGGYAIVQAESDK